MLFGMVTKLFFNTVALKAIFSAPLTSSLLICCANWSCSKIGNGCGDKFCSGGVLIGAGTLVEVVRSRWLALVLAFLLVIGLLVGVLAVELTLSLAAVEVAAKLVLGSISSQISL